MCVILVGAPPAVAATDDSATPAADAAAAVAEAASAASSDFRLDPATTRAFQALAAVTGGLVRALRQSPSLVGVVWGSLGSRPA